MIREELYPVTPIIEDDKHTMKPSATFFIIFAASFSIPWASGISLCPQIWGKVPFDASKFSGDWYVMAYKGDPALPEKKCAKIKVEVGQQDSRTTIVYKFHYQQTTGEDKTAEFFTQALRPTGPSTGFGVFVKTNYWESLVKTGIVATDYENFALVMACGPLFDMERRSFGRQIYANILGRSVNAIPPSTMAALKNILSSYDISMDSLKLVDNASCT